MDTLYPILSDREFVPTFHKKLLDQVNWETPELFRTVQFAWGVLLRGYSNKCASRTTLPGKTTSQVGPPSQN